MRNLPFFRGFSVKTMPVLWRRRKAIPENADRNEFAAGAV
jgi:hypothetical protein